MSKEAFEAIKAGLEDGIRYASQPKSKEEALLRSEFIEAIKTVMEEKGLSLYNIGQLAGASKGTVSRWLNGYSYPHPAMMRALLRELKK